MGVWFDALDVEDAIQFDRALDDRSRIDLYQKVCEAAALDDKEKPYGLTAMKDHINGKCVCD